MANTNTLALTHNLIWQALRKRTIKIWQEYTTQNVYVFLVGWGAEEPARKIIPVSDH